MSAVVGDTNLGGEYLNSNLVNRTISEFDEKGGIYIGHDTRATQRLSEAAERETPK